MAVWSQWPEKQWQGSPKSRGDESWLRLAQGGAYRPAATSLSREHFNLILDFSSLPFHHYFPLTRSSGAHSIIHIKRCTVMKAAHTSLTSWYKSRDHPHSRAGSLLYCVASLVYTCFSSRSFPTASCPVGSLHCQEITESSDVVQCRLQHRLNQGWAFLEWSCCAFACYHTPM